MLSMLVFYLFH